MAGSAKRQPTDQIVVRCTQEEFAAIDGRADRAGLTCAAFLRASAVGAAGPRAQCRPPADHQALPEILGHHGKIGSNVNQIARSLNTGGQLQIPELRPALAAYLELRTAILDALGHKTDEPDEPPHDHQGRQP